MIKTILCTDLKGGIGKDNDLLFHIKEDMQFFKQQTEHNAVIMGYNTYLSLGSKPLPNRFNIVLTDKIIEIKENMATTTDLKGTIEIYNKMGVDLYIIGGAYVYNQCLQMDLVDEIYITLVEEVIKDANTYVDITLFRNFNKAEKIKEISKGITIWKLSK
jgi:dihydrofolate reductase